MKVHVLLISVLVLSFNVLHGQTRKGGWELSLSGYLGMVKQSAEMSSPYGSSKSEGEAQGYVLLAVRPGYYITEGFMVEPEILWTAQEDYPPCFAFSGNLAYNFNIPNTHLTPFILAGYGIGNGIPITHRLIYRSSDKLDINVLNLGAGLKIFVSEQIAVRIEYRNQSYSYSYEYSDYYMGSYTLERTTTYNTVMFGFSVFL